MPRRPPPSGAGAPSAVEYGMIAALITATAIGAVIFLPWKPAEPMRPEQLVDSTVNPQVFSGDHGDWSGWGCDESGKCVVISRAPEGSTRMVYYHRDPQLGIVLDRWEEHK